MSNALLLPLVIHCRHLLFIAASGVQISHGVSRHGAALNVCPDLSFFDCIVPCGQAQRGVTSVHQVLSDSRCSVEEMHALLAKHLAKELGGG